MINRRVLRIKVMQALYAFCQNNNERVDLAEKKLIKNIWAIYDLYIHQLSFLIEIVDFARETMEIQRNKHIPTQEEINPNTRFVDNSFIIRIENNPDYINKRDRLLINWADQKDMIRRIFLKIRDDKEYKAYLKAPVCGQDEDQKILEYIIDNYFAENDELQQYFEEMNIFWADDFPIGCIMLIKTLKLMRLSEEKFEFLPPLFDNTSEEDEKQDLMFVRDLFCKTILHSDKFDDLLEGKAKNWELERIALIDSLILKMALTEFIHCPSIPAKVTINEYIELSKMYSTPKSKIFINGILDKLLIDLMDKKVIVKKGRGLV